MAAQYTIVFVLVALAVVYAAYRVYKAVRQQKQTPAACVGCPLAAQCKEEKSQKAIKKTCKKKN